MSFKATQALFKASKGIPTINQDLDLLAAQGKAFLGSFGPLKETDSREVLGEESIAVETNY